VSRAGPPRVGGGRIREGNECTNLSGDRAFHPWIPSWNRSMIRSGIVENNHDRLLRMIIINKIVNHSERIAWVLGSGSSSKEKSCR
jgi:hypothetical protein